MIQRFHAVNYKGLQMDPLEFGAVNLFIGPNNSGKSNFFGALSFLFDMFGRPEEARGSLEAALRRRANGPLLSRGAIGDVRLEWGFGEGERYEVGEGYEVGLGNSDSGMELLSEKIVRRSSNISFGFEEVGRRLIWWNGRSTGEERRERGASFLRDLRHITVDEPVNSSLTVQVQRWALDVLDKIASSSLHFRLSTFVPTDAARPRDPSRVRTLDDRGIELSNLLHSWLPQNGFTMRVVGALSPLLPGLEAIQVYEGGGHRWLQLKIRGEWLNLSELSDGTITALTLATLLFSPVKSGTLCLDEPELNLHPAWARTVASWVLRQSSWEQVMLCTHSPEVLDPFTEHFRSGEVRLFVFQRTEQGFQLRHCPPDRLEAHLQDGWLLGDLYRIGEPALGGWPW